MTAALQRKLVIGDDLLCVLLTVSAAREKLPGHDEDDLLALCQDKFIAVAFDIGLGGRRELRLLPSAVEFYRKTGGSRRGNANWADAWAEITRGFNAEKPWFDGERLRHVLCCSATHVTNLVDEGWLAEMPGTAYRRGPGGAPKITRASLERFLKGARV